jgi:hypothetical protein
MLGPATRFHNKDESAASLCCQVAAWFPDMFRDIYLVKNHKIAENSTNAKKNI